MAKKRKTRKQKQRYQAKPLVTAAKASTTSSSAPSNAQPRVEGANTAKFEVDSRWSYIRGDLVRIGLLAAGVVVVQLVLWYLINNTGLGPGLYALVKI